MGGPTSEQLAVNIAAHPTQESGFVPGTSPAERQLERAASNIARGFGAEALGNLENSVFDRPTWSAEMDTALSDTYDTTGTLVDKTVTHRDPCRDRTVLYEKYFNDGFDGLTPAERTNIIDYTLRYAKKNRMLKNTILAPRGGPPPVPLTPAEEQAEAANLLKDPRLMESVAKQLNGVYTDERARNATALRNEVATANSEYSTRTAERDTIETELDGTWVDPTNHALGRNPDGLRARLSDLTSARNNFTTDRSGYTIPGSRRRTFTVSGANASASEKLHQYKVVPRDAARESGASAPDTAEMVTLAGLIVRAENHRLPRADRDRARQDISILEARVRSARGTYPETIRFFDLHNEDGRITGESERTQGDIRVKETRLTELNAAEDQAGSIAASKKRLIEKSRELDAIADEVVKQLEHLMGNALKEDILERAKQILTSKLPTAITEAQGQLTSEEQAQLTERKRKVEEAMQNVLDKRWLTTNGRRINRQQAREDMTNILDNGNPNNLADTILQDVVSDITSNVAEQNALKEAYKGNISNLRNDIAQKTMAAHFATRGKFNGATVKAIAFTSWGKTALDSAITTNKGLDKALKDAEAAKVISHQEWNPRDVYDRKGLRGLAIWILTTLGFIAPATGIGLLFGLPGAAVGLTAGAAARAIHAGTEST